MSAGVPTFIILSHRWLLSVVGQALVGQEDMKLNGQPLLASWVSNLGINPGQLPGGGDTWARLGNPRISLVEFLPTEFLFHHLKNTGFAQVSGSQPEWH